MTVQVRDDDSGAVPAEAMDDAVDPFDSVAFFERRRQKLARWPVGAGLAVTRWGWLAAQAAASKKAQDIVIIDVGQVLAITDTFVIVSAPADRLVRAIAEEVELQVKEHGGEAPLRVEGMRQGDWVLLDYG